jgi:hypothetical protein
VRLRQTTCGLIAVMMLAGCGHTPVVTPSSQLSGAAHTASVVLDANGRAAQFAGLVKGQFLGQVTVAGASVTLTGTKSAPVVYNFTQAPTTGLVAVASQGFSTTVSNQKLIETVSSPTGTDKFLPAMIIPIAIDVAFAGAKALAFYWLTHRNDFNRDDAIKACVVGMASALLDFVPYGVYFEWLVPIAVNIISQVKVGDLKEIAAIALKDLDKIVEVIKKILHARAQAGVVSAH